MSSSEFKFDRIYKNIIIALQENARISNLDLAERVHLSPSACLKRTKKLEAQGYIRRYTTNLNLSRMCVCISMLTSFTLVNNRGAISSAKFEKAIQDTPTAVECYKISGEMDYIVNFICRDVEQYEQVTDSLLKQDIGISHIVSHLVLSTPKPFKYYPLGELTWKLDAEAND